MDILIIYIATNNYAKYCNNFFKTLTYFFPEYHKHVLYFNNNCVDNEINSYICDKITIENKFIYDLLYPTLNLNKTYLVNQIIDSVLDTTKYKYIFYFDADTIFKKNENYNWKSLCDLMDDGNILLAKHPFYALKEDTIFWGQTKKQLINNLYSQNLTEKQRYSSAYIGENTYKYINSSFYGGTYVSLKFFNNIINSMIREDLTRHFGFNTYKTYHIPQFIDENYFNKLGVEVEKYNRNDIKLSIDQYSELYNTKNEKINTVFMYQKNIEEENKTNRQ